MWRHESVLTKFSFTTSTSICPGSALKVNSQTTKMAGKSAKSLSKINEILKNTRKLSLTQRAGLVFSVARTRRMLKGHSPAKRLTTTSSVYLAAVLEYLLAELLELAANACHDNRKKLITPRFIQLAVQNDNELSKLFQNVTIFQGGVVPHIHPELLPKKNQARRQNYEDEY